MNKKLSMIAGVLGALALLAVALISWAQQPVPPAKHGAWKYNPQAVETLTGKVISVTPHTSRRPGRRVWVAMMLQTAKGNIRVALGPTDYLDQQALKLAAGDQVEVKGVQVTFHNRTHFIAGEVTKGGQVLKLRDEATGRPLWAARKRPKGA